MSTNGRQESAVSLAQALLVDFTSAPTLTTLLVDLAVTSPSSSGTTLALYSALHTLIFSILQSSSSTPVANYLVESLFPALAAQPSGSETGVGAASLVANIIIDVVWQIDQGLEIGVVKYFNPANDASEKGMDVDGSSDGDVAKSQGEQIIRTAEEVAKLEKEGRTRLAEVVKLLTQASVISTSDCLERLESTFLALPPLALLGEHVHFNRIEVRARTALFYKQQKFNLLREESEGYAKLSVELLGNMGPIHSLVDSRSQENSVQRKRRAQMVGDSVKSLIGNFDLDPDRTLDIILDTFSDQIMQHHQYFIDLLLASPWAPKRKTGAIPEAMLADEGKGKQKEKLIDVGLEKDEGSFLIGQILGFKFAYYQGVGVELAPEKLYLMTALLIWNGFVKLADIWSHLSPEDSALSAVEGRYRDEQAKLASSVGGSNALASAGALVDDDAPTRPAASTSTSTAKAAAEVRELPNQKLALLRALLTIGDISHSFFIISQFPALVAAYPDLANLLNRLLTQSIQPAYDQIAFATTHSDLVPSFTAPRSKYVPATQKAPVKAVLPTIFVTARAFPSTKRDFIFFFAEWQDRLPRAEDNETVLQVLELFLPIVGLSVVKDSSLYTKLCRLAQRGLEGKPTQSVLRWTEIVRLYLLPSIALLEHHSVAALEIWNVLRLFSIEKRFEMYGEWKDTLYRRIPALSVRKAEAERDIKSVLRRLSTDNVKTLGKSLVKIAHTNPTVVFAIVLNQVQSYDNLINPVIEAVRYLTAFGYDVLAFSLLDALSSGKTKTKDDGTSVAMWLQGLATFVGQLYRRWPAMSSSLWIVFQYLTNQLVAGNSKDLVILRELIAKMSGLEPFADLSESQVMSLGGGPLLRREVFMRTDIQNAGTKKAATLTLERATTRLTTSLRDSGLAIPILVNVAIQRQACVSDTETHLKSLGGLFDQCHAVLFQYMEFLTINLGMEELAASVPEVAVMMRQYGLEPAVAFDIGRPKLRLSIRAHDDKEIKAAEAKRKLAVAAKLALEKAVSKIEDVKMEDAPTGDSSASPAATATIPSDVLKVDSPARVSGTPPMQAEKKATSTWHPALASVISEIRSLLPESVIAFMGPYFFVTFWQFTLYDISCPQERYMAEIARMAALQKETSTSALTPADKASFSVALKKLSDNLTEECSKHMTVRSAASRRIGREKAEWFASVQTPEHRRLLVQQIIQYCIQPRAKLSLPDALYSYHFVRRMHSVNTAGFHTTLFYKAIFEQLSPLLYSCTENEARNYAQFLYSLLGDLHKWHDSEAAYKEESIGPQLQGFLKHISPLPTKVYAESDFIDHGAFKNLLIRWHTSMLNSFVKSFESGEYMHIKNSILVLTRLAPYFPIKHATGAKLESSVAALIKAESREDLKILALGYKAVLSKRRKFWTDPPPLESKPASKQSSAASSPAPSRAPVAPVVVPALVAAPKVPTAQPSPAPQVVTPSPLASNGPKHGLPARPGQTSSSTTLRPPVVARESQSDVKQVTMDVDPPTSRATSSETPRRIVESNGNTSLTPTTSKEPLGPPPRSQSSLHSSLPARPDLITPDILRQQALASQAPRRAAAMEPPAAPSRRDTELTSPKVSKRDLPSSAAPTSSSRQSSPRRSETIREREHTSRDGRSRGSGDRAVESNDRSSRHKDSSREDKERPRESSSRSSRDDDRRSDRDSNHASRSRDDYRSKDARRPKEDEKRDERRDGDSSSSRRREDGKGEAHRDRNPSDGRSDKESSNRDSRSRDTSVREPSTRDSGSSRGGSRPGQDNVSSTSKQARELPSGTAVSSDRSQPPTGPRSSRQSSAHPPSAPPAQVGPPTSIPDRPASTDRLRPAPAHSTSSSAVPPVKPTSEFNIRGAGSRLLNQAMGGSNNGSSNTTRRSSTVRSREDSGNSSGSRREKEEESSRKRPAPSLADRLADTKGPDYREEGRSQDTKRQRTSPEPNGSRDPPPHRGGNGGRR